MKKKITIWILLYFLMWCGIACGQDTINDAIYAPVAPQSMPEVQQWKTVLDGWSSQLDSVKRKLSWVRQRADTLFIDSALIFFATARDQLQQVDRLVKQAKWKEEVARKKEGATDTSGLLEIPVNDSVHLQMSVLADTLKRIEDGIAGLLYDIDYLEPSTQRRREELEAMDTVAFQKKARGQHVLKTIKKTG